MARNSAILRTMREAETKDIPVTYLYRMALSIAILVFGTDSAGAQCDQPVAVSAKKSDAIFVGKVIDIKIAQVAHWAVRAGSESWDKVVQDVELVTFDVQESIKPRNLKRIVVSKTAHTFVGTRGELLMVGNYYLVYATKRRPAGTSVEARKWRKYYGKFPKPLALEIDTFNRNVTPYQTGLCSRTTLITSATSVELELLRLLHSRKKRTKNR